MLGLAERREQGPRLETLRRQLFESGFVDGLFGLSASSQAVSEVGHQRRQRELAHELHRVLPGFDAPAPNDLADYVDPDRISEQDEGAGRGRAQNRGLQSASGKTRQGVQ